MQNLQTFNFDELPVRTLTVDDEPYFVGKDVSDILGYSNSRKALSDHVDEEDKLTSQIVTAGQRRNQTLINESGLYSLIFSSKLDSAKR
ncbi:Bro-N domain-containing protein, partial [Staphylococcus pseudintermedius]